MTLYFTRAFIYAIIGAMESAATNKLFVYDCCLGKLRVSDCDFMTIGAAEQNTFRVHMTEARGGAFAIRGDTCRFYPNGQIKDFSLNGKHHSADCDISINILHLMVLGNGCFLVWFGKEEQRPDFSPFDPTYWYTYNKSEAKWGGPYILQALADIADTADKKMLATFPGLDGQAFYLHDIQQVAQNAPIKAQQPSAPAVPVKAVSKVQPAPRRQLTATVSFPPLVAGNSTELVCPHCQHRFTERDILAIAAHHELRGDSILGNTAMRRFHPSKLDNRGIPIDESGSSCPECACPACHMHVPAFFKQTIQHIVPIIGSAGSGKTYYLLSLIQQMELDVPRLFNAAFRDADPTGNAVLTHLKNQVFSAKTPQQAYVGHTRTNGKFYQQVWDDGAFRDSPRPFIFNLNKQNETHALVLYDSAGETFMPDKGEELHRKWAHLQSPSGCMFLYDPCEDNAFSRLLEISNEVSADHQHTPQTTLLTETELQLRLRMNAPHGQKLNIPFAFIVGKADLWQHLLGPEPLLPMVHNGKLITEHVAANSRRIRQFLFNINPSICTIAESISKNMCYFAASALGTTPIKFRDSETGELLLAPQPEDLRPQGVTSPLLWILSQCDKATFSAT